MHLVSLFNPKARKWVEGRKDLYKKLEQAIPADEKIIWVHCASLGEFEQGRPVIERLRTQGTGHKLLLTFFSPSGYEAQKDYKGANWVFYLPMDGPRNARRFLEIVHPSLVIFVKYEFWYYYLKKIKYRNIPLLLISALFRKDMSFFKWYGGLQRKILSRFDHLFVQNESSKELLHQIGLSHITSVSGDTRFDRVIEIAEKFEPLPLIEQFIGNKITVVAGSTWKEDEELLSRFKEDWPNDDKKWIIAPHEISQHHMTELKKLFPDSVLYSELTAAGPDKSVLLIDNVGMLSKLYRYATVAFIGGGFSKGGIHNVLEAAVYGKPVMFGPNYSKYYEASQLIETGAAISIDDRGEFDVNIDLIAYGIEINKEMSRKAKDYVYANKGATDKIVRFIQEKRLLTN